MSCELCCHVLGGKRNRMWFLSYLLPSSSHLCSHAATMHNLLPDYLHQAPDVFNRPASELVHASHNRHIMDDLQLSKGTLGHISLQYDWMRTAKKEKKEKSNHEYCFHPGVFCAHHLDWNNTNAALQSVITPMSRVWTHQLLDFYFFLYLSGAECSFRSLKKKKKTSSMSGSFWLQSKSQVLTCIVTIITHHITGFAWWTLQVTVLK